MKATVFEGYTVGKIERGIPFPIERMKSLSVEQKQLLALKDGESLVLEVDFGELSINNAKRLGRWARSKGIKTTQRRISNDLVEIWRVGPCDRR
ncbi:hypothetical protein [Rhodanobacter sp. L36]|uniref:hypothetical protein n=1 Tax=Rhodanobacter sp. L36 TaxID=1747221 RepID=UPI00131DDF8E|nr:hypothetical protein [Rhodanobacter sp. L36]